MTRPRIVLAEDHLAMATELERLLATEFDVVEVARDGRELIESEARARPDAVVCDIVMPGTSGLAAAEAILAARPDSRIVFVTAQGDRALIRRCLDSGGTGYVLKCDAGEELLPAVRAALRGERYLSANARAGGGDADTVPAGPDPR